MTKQWRRPFQYVVLLGIAGLFATGCARSGTARYDIQVRLADSMSDSVGILPSVEVHLIALEPVAGRILQDYSMSDYWNPNRKPDQYAKHIIRFGEGKPSTQKLSRKNPIWRQWAETGASYLFVMADLQGLYEDKKDVSDPRRLILPLDPSRWQHRAIQVMIEKGGVFCLTPRLPKAAK